MTKGAEAATRFVTARVARSALAPEQLIAQLVCEQGARVFTYFAQRPAPSSAQDLLQETFTRMRTALTGRRPIRDLSTYAMTVAVNVLNEYNWHPAEELDASDPWLPEQVQDALKHLPPKCRAALVLHCRDQLPYEMIARLLDVSPTMVERCMATGLSQFDSASAANARGTMSREPWAHELLRIRIAEEASEWLVRLNDGAIRKSRHVKLEGQLKEWLLLSPQHMAAFLRMNVLWHQLREPDMDVSTVPELLSAAAAELPSPVLFRLPTPAPAN